ncbi:NAD(P)-dependent oxidoreductase (plasmid) [Deinococcus metallilatus]|uniref:SDR family mycofactocin-dependent oxidoreductase n=1 Tax=Deinococcus metallilatus TaxID=1211322 RepID=A0ABR6MNM1_9DEIO|nr:SDR family NAD(P)-dependent oxidoreductase [Deinococcus metallilatus]MBB5293533.1 SDR family mycofactocin-dependent oxidoreductase [Deinococcus metallilatus]QBY06608.1 NAD(P)-dependent oxidoreductase [Deinococcus metallilatus]RXJ17951.1 NAD(P)-dependent oxidoreductase [Deinococcus metallilatus]GMA15246.1 putative short-chain dehydrogenase/reductase [Deinococcus metallilatus]
MQRLADKTAVVTGAARGIGRAIAVAFAREGAVVVGLDQAGQVSKTTAYPPATPADLEETGRLVREAGSRFIGIQVDIRDLAALRGVAERVRNDLGHLDILVANAGIQVFAPLLEMNDAQWNDVIDTNLTGTANTVRAFAPLMAERGYGRIIVTASGQGKKGLRHGSSYAASKWGIIGFMKSAAMDLGQHHITVNALVPGLISTDMTCNETRLTEAYEDYRPPTSQPPSVQEVARVRAEHSPLGLPWLPPEDIAPMVVFLASDEAKHISGATFAVDAGASSEFTG